MAAAGISPWQAKTGQFDQQGRAIVMEEKLESCKDVPSTSYEPYMWLLLETCWDGKNEQRNVHSSRRQGIVFGDNFTQILLAATAEHLPLNSQTPATLFRFHSNLILCFFIWIFLFNVCLNCLRLDLRALEVPTAWLPVNDVYSPHVCASGIPPPYLHSENPLPVPLFCHVSIFLRPSFYH